MNVLPFASAARLSSEVDAIARQADNLLNYWKGDRYSAIAEAKLQGMYQSIEHSDFWANVVVELEHR